MAMLESVIWIGPWVNQIGKRRFLDRASTTYVKLPHASRRPPNAGQAPGPARDMARPRPAGRRPLVARYIYRTNRVHRHIRVATHDPADMASAWAAEPSLKPGIPGNGWWTNGDAASYGPARLRQRIACMRAAPMEQRRQQRSMQLQNWTDKHAPYRAAAGPPSAAGLRPHARARAHSPIHASLQLTSLASRAQSCRAGAWGPMRPELQRWAGTPGPSSALELVRCRTRQRGALACWR